MANLNINEADLKRVVTLVIGYVEGMNKNFKAVGSDLIKNCGITGDKQTQLLKLSEGFEDSMDSITKSYGVIAENIKSFITDVMGVNAEDYFASCRASLENSTSGSVKERQSRFKK